ncbi:MAG: hypothetical protein Q7U47_03395 [Paludibacter sp.]|nr:hypothetical protein [Paludibacter sp.]
MDYEIEQKLRKITDAWDSLIIPYQFCKEKINFEEQELTDYIVGIGGYFHDTFEIILEPRNYDGFAEMFSYYISYLQAIYIQQDLVIELLGLFNLENSKKVLNDNRNFSLNRNIRNELVGHPISRNSKKKYELTSATMFSYVQAKDSIEYLQYHRKNDFKIEIVSYNISEIRNRHTEFLNYYFDKITEKINEILKLHLVILDDLLTNINSRAFSKIIDELSKYFELIFSFTYEFEKEKIKEIYNKQEEHRRYENMIDYFLYIVNFSLLEAKNQVISFIEKREFLVVNRNELIYKYDVSRNKEFHYELIKLSEINSNMHNFEFNSKIIRDRFPDDLDIKEELDNMNINRNNIIEYYCSFELLNQLINKKTNNYT